MALQNTKNDTTQFNYLQLAGPYYRIFVEGIPLDKYPWLSKQIKGIELTEISSGLSEDGQALSGIEPLDMATITIIDAYENLTANSNNLVSSGSISGNPGNILDLIIESTSSSSNIRVLSSADLKQRKTVVTSSAPTNTTTPQFLYVTAISAELQGANLLLTLDQSFPSGILGQNIYIGTINNTNVLGQFQAGTIQQILPSTNQILVSGLTGIATAPASIDQPLTIYYVASLASPEVITKNSKTAKFLFQEDNTIDIEWGYRSHPSLTRRMRFVIKYVEYQAPDSAAPEAKIYCVPSAISDLQKNHPTIGQAFYQLFSNPNGNIDTRPVTAGELVKTLAKEIGYKAIVSNTANKLNYDDRVDTSFVTRCTPDMSVLQFIAVLATKVHHHFETGFDYTSGKNVIFFLSDEDYSNKHSFALVWKGGNTLLRSYTLRVDFSKLPNGASTAIDPNNPSAGIQTEAQDESSLTVALKSPTETDRSRISTATSTPVTSGLNNVFTGNPSQIPGTLGSSTYSSMTSTNSRKIALDPLIRKNQFPAIITGVMIGYPFMCPCIVRVDNIGRRYSGRYRLISVKHVIDASSYKIEFTGNTNVATDTLQDSSLPAGDKDPSDQSLQVQVRSPSIAEQAQSALGINLGIPPLDTNGDAQSYTSTPQVPGKVKNLGGVGAIPLSLFQSPPGNGVTE